jgi:hypothetical protein
MAHELVFGGHNYHRPSKSDTTVYRKLLDTLTFGGADAAERLAVRHVGREPVSVGLEVFRDYSETAVMASLLGFLKAKGMLDPMGVPVDGTMAGLGALIKVWCGRDSGIGTTAGNLGLTGNVCYWLRTVERLSKARTKLAAHGEDGSGDYTEPTGFDADGEASWGDDPVFKVAETL